MRPLNQTTQLLYSELLQQCAVSLPNKRGISFARKTVRGHRYWYMELVVGSTKRQFSLGRDSEALREQIDRQKDQFAQSEPDLKQREKLVAMLISGGAFTPGATVGRVLEVLAQSGTFLSGGVLVGSHAFTSYANMLGVSWESSSTRTQDLDLASPRHIKVVVGQQTPDLKSVLLESGMSFFEIPALNPKSPSTSYKLRGAELHVDLLTPLNGPPKNKPVYLSHFKSYAYPIRFLEFLLEDNQPTAIPFRSGILVNTPHPARFALHKLVVARRRPIAQRSKSAKDIRQAQQLLEVLLPDRAGDVLLALDAARSMPKSYQQALQAGLSELPTEIRDAVPKISD